MNKNKNLLAALVVVLGWALSYSVAAQSRPVSNPAGATKNSAKSKTSKINSKTAKKNNVKGKQKDDEVTRNGETIVLPMKYLGVSEPLSELARRNIPPVSQENGPLQEIEPMEVLHDVDESKDENSNAIPPPAPIQTETFAPAAATRGANFDGIGTGLTGSTVNVAPPDTTMAVGPNHIVQWVNSQYVIFNKSGTVLVAPTNGNVLFTGTGNVCATTNRGDPILQYDRMADRWFLSQFAFNTSGNSIIAPYLQCIAVSTTNDPTGTYYRYAITFSSTSPSGFNDYGKLGVWTDAYYTAYNMFGGSPAGGNSAAGLCASDRTKMLAGDNTATTLCSIGTFAGGPFGFIPADFDGTEQPTNTTQGGIFIRYSTTGNLRLMKLKPNFAAGTATLTDGVGGAASSFINVNVGVIPRPCNAAGGNCIAQPGTTTTLDTLGDRLMYRAAYRNRGGTDSLIITFTTDPDAAGTQNSAVRWFEIRNPFSATPTLFQNGTFNPGAAGDRWMGSMAMDKFGNMMMGYSVANAATLLKPSIAIAGRQAGDAVNTLQAEIIDTTGTGSQTTYSPGGVVTPLTRWGDYSTMQIDPADDTTFWFTTEYLTLDGTFNWRTRITSYKFPITVTTATLDGNISDGTKFDNGAPSSTLNVVIPAGRTITVNTPTTVNSLTVAAGAILVMNANLTVQGDLTLGTKIDTGANTLGLGCVSNVAGASASNYVIGNLKKDFCGVGAFSFPTGTTNGFSPVNTNVTVLGINPSSLTIKANQGNKSGMNSGQSLQRYWTLTESGDLTTDLTFNYLDPTDIVGSEAGYALYRFTGSTGTAVSPFTLNAGLNTISTGGVSAFSDWAVGSLAPTAAESSVSGKVYSASGRPLANALVTFTGSQNETFTATTSQNGRFLLDGLPSGQTYIVTIAAKGFRFAPQVLNVNENLTGIIFTATR